ncbi:MAG: alpha/beta hydrolase [Oscillospiraceae bacterium]|nr:alpha/beta hydrolase [Oscillospiraceae bacterium]
MSIAAFMFRRGASRGDAKRNAATAYPAGVVCKADIRYGPEAKDHLLNVYYPEGTTGRIPTIVSIHGGGYVYGDKEVYHFYCADLARRGFAVVNFNYRLAPKHRFPAPLEDTNRVMKWLTVCADKYHLDPERLFIVGDSAGAQLASHYAAIAKNPEFARLFSFTVPEFSLLALGLNCGMYDLPAMVQGRITGIAADYLGRRFDRADPRIDVLGAIGENYPPSFLLTANNDFLRENAQPMADFLSEKGVETVCKCWGTEEKPLGHVFHVDIRLEEAAEANDHQCDFFRNYL